MKSNRFLMGALSMALALSSCTNNESAFNGDEVVEGIPTMAQFVLSQSGTPKTKAPVDSEVPTDKEKAVDHAIVFVFNGNDELEAKVKITSGSSTANFSITTGKKRILAAANFGDTYFDGIKNNDKLEDVQKALIDIADMNGMTVDNKFWMTNVAHPDQETVLVATDAEVTAGTKNNFTVNIGRTCAKVNMELLATAPQTGGALTDVKYRVRNNPKRMHTFPVFEGSQLKAPYFALPWGDQDADAGSGTLGTAVNAGSYFGTGDGGPAPTFTAAKTFSYMMENSNQKSVIQGKATYLSIQGKWTPDNNATLVKADGTTPADAGEITGGTFWRIADMDGTKIKGFSDARIFVEQPTIVPGATESIVKYDGGICYYDLWIADNSQTDEAMRYAINRNSYYYVTINSVSGPGTADEDDMLNPDKPVETDAFMKATINVLPWKVIDQAGDI